MKSVGEIANNKNAGLAKFLGYLRYLTFSVFKNPLHSTAINRTTNVSLS